MNILINMINLIISLITEMERSQTLPIGADSRQQVILGCDSHGDTFQVNLFENQTLLQVLLGLQGGTVSN